MNTSLNDVETIIFCDETKFSLRNNDKENAIYYLGVAVPKNDIPRIRLELRKVFENHRVKADVPHATNLFRENRVRPNLMDELTDIIIQNELKCFCHKYHKETHFDRTKILNRFNNDIIDFNKSEFQALFYFVTVLNVYLSESRPDLLKKQISMFFDRNVYGVKDTEAFRFTDEYYVLKQMTFVEKSKIDLLFLPDFFGYIFRKSKKSKNVVDFGDKNLEKSPLTINAFSNLIRISEAKLFHFIEMNPQTIADAMKLILK